MTSVISFRNSALMVVGANDPVFDNQAYVPPNAERPSGRSLFCVQLRQHVAHDPRPWSWDTEPLCIENVEAVDEVVPRGHWPRKAGVRKELELGQR